MPAKLTYQIVGRYMDGNEVTGYHLQCSNGTSGRFDRKNVCYLVGRGQVTNCSGQLYKDKVILRGIGMSLEDLPIQKESKTSSKTSNTPNNTPQLTLTHSIISGRQTIGYVIRDTNGATKSVSRNELLSLARAGKIRNIGYQENNGKPALRGIGIKLTELPKIDAISAGLTSATNQNVPPSTDITEPYGNLSDLSKEQIDFLRNFNKSVLKIFKKHTDLLAGDLINPSFRALDNGSKSLILSGFDFAIKSRNNIFPSILFDGKSVSWVYYTYKDDEYECKIEGTSLKVIDKAFSDLLTQIYGSDKHQNERGTKSKQRPKSSNHTN